MSGLATQLVEFFDLRKLQKQSDGQLYAHSIYDFIFSIPEEKPIDLLPIFSLCERLVHAGILTPAGRKLNHPNELGNCYLYYRRRLWEHREYGACLSA